METNQPLWQEKHQAQAPESQDSPPGKIPKEQLILCHAYLLSLNLVSTESRIIDVTKIFRDSKGLLIVRIAFNT